MAQTSNQVKHRKLRHRAGYQKMLKEHSLSKKAAAWMHNQGGSHGRFKRV